ncbi:hypothetical protein Hokovirus_2_249 [Hokovirus HKV1]|uniref:Uncharacterized protein n=1 Tax=Hokovirus HKV1 TaxID=1977638 RepID=A0A1V0SG73_9VIRU|nr:hypothetical protein Hokovirus_2_249 [Hokovirus HKV1]
MLNIESDFFNDNNIFKLQMSLLKEYQIQDYLVIYYYFYNDVLNIMNHKSYKKIQKKLFDACLVSNLYNNKISDIHDNILIFKRLCEIMMCENYNIINFRKNYLEPELIQNYGSGSWYYYRFHQIFKKLGYDKNKVAKILSDKYDTKINNELCLLNINLTCMKYKIIIHFLKFKLITDIQEIHKKSCIKDNINKILNIIESLNNNQNLINLYESFNHFSNTTNITYSVNILCDLGLKLDILKQYFLNNNYSYKKWFNIIEKIPNTHSIMENIFNDIIKSKKYHKLVYFIDSKKQKNYQQFHLDNNIIIDYYNNNYITNDKNKANDKKKTNNHDKKKTNNHDKDNILNMLLYFCKINNFETLKIFTKLLPHKIQYLIDINKINKHNCINTNTTILHYICNNYHDYELDTFFNIFNIYSNTFLLNDIQDSNNFKASDYLPENIVNEAISIVNKAEIIRTK